MLKTKKLKKKIKYDGRQLASHWIYENTGILGDSLVSFEGPADVLEHLVDQIDRKKHQFIYSPLMLHFIVEHFGASLKEIVLRQQILVDIVFDEINRMSGKIILEGRGNDLFFKGKKLSVSISTVSPISGLIHLGLNIKIDQKVPVKAAGLIDAGIPSGKLSEIVMRKYSQFCEYFDRSLIKVRGVR
jgi:uncharacterized protein